MITEWILIIVLHSQIGPDQRPKAFTGERMYADEKTCMMAGREAASWLSQDFLSIGWMCVPRTGKDI